VEIFRVDVSCLFLRDLAELEPAENMTDVTLGWDIGPSIKDALPVLRRWRYLNRLTLNDGVNNKISVPPLEVISGFIMGMKHLTHLNIVSYYDRSNYGQLNFLRDKVNEMILPRRPNFKFNISRI
jgi:hypothetical protein